MSADAAPLGAPSVDMQGRCLVTEHRAFALQRVRAPARQGVAERVRFWGLLRRAMRARRLSSGGKPIVLCGDLNVRTSVLDTSALDPGETNRSRRGQLAWAGEGGRAVVAIDTPARGCGAVPLHLPLRRVSLRHAANPARRVALGAPTCAAARPQPVSRRRRRPLKRRQASGAAQGHGCRVERRHAGRGAAPHRVRRPTRRACAVSSATGCSAPTACMVDAFRSLRPNAEGRFATWGLPRNPSATRAASWTIFGRARPHAVSARWLRSGLAARRAATWRGTAPEYAAQFARRTPGTSPCLCYWRRWCCSASLSTRLASRCCCSC
jgi:hypothetical protein